MSLTSAYTKNDVIQGAYQDIRISGLTVNPTPGDEVLALNRYESMMAEFFNSYNLDVEYNFEDTPDLNSLTFVIRAYEPMMRLQLAVRLIPAFNKQVPMELKQLASSAWSGALGAVKRHQIRPIQPSRRYPRGSGNTFRNIYLNRFSIPEPLPPISAANNRIFVGDIDDYFEDYAPWLEGNTIDSFTITTDPRLTLDSSSNESPRIDYRITGSEATGQGVWQFVKITVIDSIGRTQIRLVSFEVIISPSVPRP